MFGFRSFKVQTLLPAVVEFSLKQIQSFYVILNNYLNNNLKQPRDTSFDFF